MAVIDSLAWAALDIKPKDLIGKLAVEALLPKWCDGNGIFNGRNEHSTPKIRKWFRLIGYVPPHGEADKVASAVREKIHHIQMRRFDRVKARAIPERDRLDELGKFIFEQGHGSGRKRASFHAIGKQHGCWYAFATLDGDDYLILKDHSGIRRIELTYIPADSEYTMRENLTRLAPKQVMDALWNRQPVDIDPRRQVFIIASGEYPWKLSVTGKDED